jgi:transcription initiation factor TFIID subunit 1, fungi type
MAGLTSQRPASQPSSNMSPERYPETQASSEEADEQLIKSFIRGDEEAQEKLASLDFSAAKPIDQSGKADDAIDYEDFSDDELPDEEDTGPTTVQNGSGLWSDDDTKMQDAEMDSMFPEDNGAANNGDDFDDLFGDIPSSPILNGETSKGQTALDNGDDLFQLDKDDSAIGMVDQQDADGLFRDVNFGSNDLQRLLAEADAGMFPQPPENREELLKILFPNFDRENPRPFFLSLLPPKKANYVGKQPLKAPKPLATSKLSLDVAADQEKIFKSQGLPIKKGVESEASGFVPSLLPASLKTEEEDVEMSSGEEEVGGVSWNDLQLACEDWDAMIDAEVSDDAQPEPRELDLFEDDEDEWSREFEVPSAKRQKVTKSGDFTTISTYLPSFDHFEDVTSSLAKTVYLDMNDQHLLFDDKPDVVAVRKPTANGGAKRALMDRYNVSNDKAYELLKANHQNKTRSLIGNHSVEHGLPALKLQWPYVSTTIRITISA